MTNALKYSPSEAPVTASVRQSGGEIVVAATDRGVGIPVAEVPRLFDRYSRAAAAREGSDGSDSAFYTFRGPGEAHGGRIWVESEAGKGSTFSFTLPVARQPEDLPPTD